MILGYSLFFIVSDIGGIYFLFFSLVRKATYDWVVTSVSRSFSFLMTRKTFLIVRFTWRVFALYIMKPIFESSGKD